MSPRLIFGCGCPIYARLVVRHPDASIAPFEFNGSLSKLGVRERLAAEELVEQWTVQFLSGSGRKLDPTPSRPSSTLFRTISTRSEERSIPAKKPPVRRCKRSVAFSSHSHRSFRERGIVYLKDVKTEHLSAFQETWQGRLRKNRKTGELVRQPKSQLGKQKNQEFLKMFFRRARELRWMSENPADYCFRSEPRGSSSRRRRQKRSKSFWKQFPACFPTSRSQ